MAKGDGDDYANAYQLFYGDSAKGSSQDLLLAVSDGGNAASYFESASGVVIPVGVFTHVAATVQGTTAALYINGKAIPGLYFHGSNQIISLAVALTSNRSTDNGSIRIGARNGQFFFAGIIDEVSIYNRALSAAEIGEIFAAGSAGKCKCAATIQPPIDADGSSVFSAKRGVVPVKFTLAVNAVPTCNLPPATISLTRTAGTATGPIDESVYALSADTGSNFPDRHHKLPVRL